jgi:hypothetical protein
MLHTPVIYQNHGNVYTYRNAEMKISPKDNARKRGKRILQRKPSVTVFLHFLHILPNFRAVLRIQDVLVRIRIRGSMPLSNGSGCESGFGSESFCFHH